MKFIRDIISEKRGVRPAGAPMPSAPPGDAGFAEPAMPNLFAEAPAAAPPAFDLPDPSEEAELASVTDDGYDGADEFSDSELDAWVNGDVALADDDDTLPEDIPAWPVQADDADLEPAAFAEPVEPAARPPSTEGPLVLDAGSLRGPKPVSPFERLRNLDLRREEASAPPALPPRQNGDDARLRLALKGHEQPQAAPAPLIAGPVAETRVRLAPEPALQRVPAFAEPAAELRMRPVEAPASQPSLSEMPFVSARSAAAPEDIAPDTGIQVPPPAAGRGSSRSGRVKTRLLGFNPENLGLSNPLEKPESRANDPFPVAWLVVVAGPGRGASFALHDGVARVGRGEDQTVCLNFGDNSISRENHVSVAYDSEQNAFFIGQSGRSNIVRLNNKPLLSTEQIRGGDQIRVGETTLRLVPLCGDGFSWAASA